MLTVYRYLTALVPYTSDRRLARVSSFDILNYKQRDSEAVIQGEKRARRSARRNASGRRIAITSSSIMDSGTSLGDIAQ
jgi:hypothetical protein